MPTYNDYAKDITTQNNTANTHEQMKNLVEWYGSALRQAVESGTFDGKKGIVKPLTGGKTTQAEATNLSTKLSNFLAAAENATTGGTVPAYCGKLWKNIEKKAKIDEDDARDDVQAGDNDEASELYVDAAIGWFRAAICIFHENSLGNPRFANQPIRKAAQDYAAALTKAAQFLNDAATNEAQGDDLEIIAECILAKAFLALATAMLTKLQNSGTLQPGEKPNVTAAVNQTTTVGNAVDTNLNPHVK